MRSAFLSLIFFVFIAAATTAQGAEDVPRSVRSLARQLADDHLAVRDAAEQGLIEIGPAALPYLPVPNAQMPAEVLRRLNRVRQQLELKRSQDATDGRRLSLKAKARKLSSVLRELEKLSGNRVVDYRQVRGQPNIELPITVDLQNVPFWQALDRILDEAGMAVYPYAHDKRGRPLRAVAFIESESINKTRSQRAYYHSGFRFEPIRVVSERNYRKPLADGMEISVQTAWEPRLTPIRLVLLRNTITATDEQGRDLKQTSRGRSEIAIDRGPPTFIVPFELPDRNVRKITRLHGELEALLPGLVETFRFDLSSQKEWQVKKAGAAVTLESVRQDGPNWDVRIRVRFDDAAGSLESHLSDWVLRNEVYLQDATGHKSEPISMQETAEKENEFGMAFKFNVKGSIDGYTFVYKTPTVVLERRIPFELSNLPLP
jgi:hypothetical protein